MSHTRLSRYYKAGKEAMYPISNILQLTEPDTYIGEIVSYQRTHSALEIACRPEIQINQLPTYRLLFGSMIHLDLPVYWIGMDMCVNSPEECTYVMSQTMPKYMPITQDLLEKYTLLSIRSKNRISTILAGGVDVFTM